MWGWRQTETWRVERFRVGRMGACRSGALPRGRRSGPRSQSGAVGVDARVLRVGLIVQSTVQRAGAEREKGAGRAGAVWEALETKAVADAASGFRQILRLSRLRQSQPPKT